MKQFPEKPLAKRGRLPSDIDGDSDPPPVCEDHEWEVIDDSYDHEYGTEQIVFQRCKLCDAEREYEQERFDDDVI